MSHSERKIDWCLKKAEQEGDRHRGLKRVTADPERVQAHVQKAEHNLRAITDFKNMGYSDWSAAAAFYAIYHCLLAIILKYGFESRNQECTFALVQHLIESGKLGLDPVVIDRLHALQPSQEEPNITDLRETEQYGVSLSLDAQTFEFLLQAAQETLDKTKEIVLG